MIEIALIIPTILAVAYIHQWSRSFDRRAKYIHLRLDKLEGIIDDAYRTLA